MARVTGDLFVELLTDPKNFHSFHLSILCVCGLCSCVWMYVHVCVYTLGCHPSSGTRPPCSS